MSVFYVPLSDDEYAFLFDVAEAYDVHRMKVQAAGKTVAEPKRGKFFSEPTLDVADAGSRVGDPRAAAKRREADLNGAYGYGTVKIPGKGEKGRTKLVEAPATEANVRLALEYWRTRKPRTDASRQAQNENVSSLVRRLEAMRQAEVVVHAPVDAPVSAVVVAERKPRETSMGASVSPEGLTRHVLAGPAIVQGPNMSADPAQRPQWTNPATGQKEVAAARLSGALTERLDRTVADERPKAHRSDAQRSNYRRKLRKQGWKASATVKGSA